MTDDFVGLKVDIDRFGFAAETLDSIAETVILRRELGIVDLFKVAEQNDL